MNYGILSFVRLAVETGAEKGLGQHFVQGMAGSTDVKTILLVAEQQAIAGNHLACIAAEAVDRLKVCSPIGFMISSTRATSWNRVSHEK